MGEGLVAGPVGVCCSILLVLVWSKNDKGGKDHKVLEIKGSIFSSQKQFPKHLEKKKREL